MAKIQVFTAARSAAIEAASIVSGVINSSGRLILSRNDGTTIDAGAVLGTVPLANTGVAGLVALATGAEAIAGTDSAKAVTPNALAAVTTDRTASNVDVTAGTSTAKYVTPASLVSRLATTALAGLVRLATSAEAQAGTATDRAVTPAALASLVGTGSGYRFGGPVVFTTSGNFTKATYPGLRAVRVRHVGSAGAGGGATIPVSGGHSQGGGGGGGAYGESFILASALAASETVTVGAGGTGVSGNDGNNGGNSAFGTFITSTGGLGGQVIGGSALQVSAPGGQGGVITAGDIRGVGHTGETGTGDGTLGTSGSGGGSVLGGGGIAVYNGAGGGSFTGNAGLGYGGGGSGAANNNGAASNRAGGPGTGAIFIVELYY